jgi:hypothetical protein
MLGHRSEMTGFALGRHWAALFAQPAKFAERENFCKRLKGERPQLLPYVVRDGADAHFIQLNQVELVLAAPIAGGGIPAGGSDVVWSFHVFSVFYLPPDMPATARIRSAKISEKRLAGI